MIQKKLSNPELERVYDLIADGVDAAPAEKRELFLAKLALALANLTGDPEAVAEAVEAAGRDL